MSCDTFVLFHHDTSVDQSRVRGHALVRWCALTMVALAMASPALAELACDTAKHVDVISGKSAPLTQEKIGAIRKGMSMWEIVKILGPAARNIGSGLFVLEWEDTNGRFFIVGGTSLCKPAIYAQYK
jgi:hypothetical protein